MTGNRARAGATSGGPVLVTGADGFVGGHLVAHLEAEGHRVVRGGRTATADGTVACDVGDRATVARAIAEARPDVVINLAGIADPGEAERDPVLAYAVNVIGQLHLIQALLQSAPSARLVVIGSAHMYGAAAPTSTIREDAPLQPHSVYGATKAAADLQALAYHLSHGLNCVRLRLFNLIGPGRQEAYFPGRQVRQLADILEGRAPPVLDTFSLTGTRDFVDVRDAVRAIEHAARLGATGAAYNVASGRATPLRTVAERLIALAGVPVEIREQATAGAGRGFSIGAGDAGALRRDTGWQPAHTLDDTLRDSLSRARARLRRAAAPTP